MNKSFALSLISVALLAGCAGEVYQGHGEFFHLANKNVIERDLSPPQPDVVLAPIPIVKKTEIEKEKTKPVSQTQVMKKNQPMSLVEAAIHSKKIKHVKTVPIKKPIKTTIQIKKKEPVLMVKQGERYQDAITRWLNIQGFEHVAWSVDDATSKMLTNAPDKPLKIKGDIRDAVALVSQRIEHPLLLTLSYKGKIAGVHQYRGYVQLITIKGKTVQDGVANIAKDYGWKWKPENWFAVENYELIDNYPMITRQGDVSQALSNVLDGYPLSASLLDSTKTVYIVEE